MQPVSDGDAMTSRHTEFLDPGCGSQHSQLVTVDIDQPLVADAEMVGDLVEDSTAHLAP
jgi:hypothetical protein